MASPYTVDSLLPMLRLLPLMPAVQALFTDPNLVAILDFEMGSKIVPMMDNQGEEYFVDYVDVPYTQSITVYDIPTRALAGKLRAVSFLDYSGSEIRVPRLRPEDIMSNVNATGLAINPALWGFFLKGNKIILYLNSVNGGSSNYQALRMRIIRMPNTLVLSAACGQVTSISGNDVTVSNLPSTFTTLVTYDLISNVPNFNSLLDDAVVTSINSGTKTLTFALGTVPSSLAIGDWICLARQSPIPQIPFYPGFDLLLQLGAAKCLEIHGDTEGFNVAMSQAKDMKDYFISVITPRVDGNVIRLTTPNSLYAWD